MVIKYKKYIIAIIIFCFCFDSLFPVFALDSFPKSLGQIFATQIAENQAKPFNFIDNKKVNVNLLKGDLGERFTDYFFRNHFHYKPLNIHKKGIHHHGIDNLFIDKNNSLIVVESKFGSSQLITFKNSEVTYKQLSPIWVRNRLLKESVNLKDTNPSLSNLLKQYASRPSKVKRILSRIKFLGNGEIEYKITFYDKGTQRILECYKGSIEDAPKILKNGLYKSFEDSFENYYGIKPETSFFKQYLNEIKPNNTNLIEGAFYQLIKQDPNFRIRYLMREAENSVLNGVFVSSIALGIKIWNKQDELYKLFRKSRYNPIEIAKRLTNEKWIIDAFKEFGLDTATFATSSFVASLMGLKESTTPYAGLAAGTVFSIINFVRNNNWREFTLSMAGVGLGTVVNLLGVSGPGGIFAAVPAIIIELRENYLKQYEATLRMDLRNSKISGAFWGADFLLSYYNGDTGRAYYSGVRFAFEGVKYIDNAYRLYQFNKENKFLQFFYSHKSQSKIFSVVSKWFTTIDMIYMTYSSIYDIATNGITNNPMQSIWNIFALTQGTVFLATMINTWYIQTFIINKSMLNMAWYGFKGWLGMAAPTTVFSAPLAAIAQYLAVANPYIIGFFVAKTICDITIDYISAYDPQNDNIQDLKIKYLKIINESKKTSVP